MGKIGKPQKSNKHKKLKKTFDSDDHDLSIGQKRNKLQNLPVDDEDLDKQEIPRKVREIMKSQTDIKKGNKQKKKSKKKFKKAMDASFKMERGMTKPLTPIPRFVQGKHEKDRNFIGRVELETRRVLMKSKMEQKYKIQNTDNARSTSNTTMVPVKKRTGDRKREKGKERKKMKVEAIKEKKLEMSRDFSVFKDEVAFGEVAMAPPSLTAKPRKVTKDDEKPRPGKRSLLLKDMIEGYEKSTSGTSTDQTDSTVRTKPKSQAQRQTGQTVKRKYLSPVQKQITDFQRRNAINLYRKIKEKQITQPR